MRPARKPGKHRQIVDREVEAVRWGPTWEEMKIQAKWLGSRGVYFQFDSDHKPDAEHRLPGLWVYTHRFDLHEVRIGDWLVVPEQGRVRVMTNEEFRKDHP